MAPDGFPFVVRHIKCGKIAFYLSKFNFMKTVNAADARMPDGTTPEASSVMICGACGQAVEGLHMLDVGVLN